MSDIPLNMQDMLESEMRELKGLPYRVEAPRFHSTCLPVFQRFSPYLLFGGAGGT